MTKLVTSAVLALSVTAGGAALRYSRSASPQLPATEPRATESPPSEGPPVRRAPVARETGAVPATQPGLRAEGNRLGDEYVVLERRSIFAPPNGAGRTPAVPNAQAVPDGRFVLKGISQRGTHFVAFVEQTGNPAVLELGVKNRLGRGQVAAISLHSLEYEADGHVTRVEVGDGFAGAAGSPVTHASGTESQATAPAPPPAPAPVAPPAPAPALAAGGRDGPSNQDRAALAANPRGGRR